MNELSSEEQERYLRQIILPDIGMEGQLRLKNAHILCIGAGGLASSVLMYLTAAGVGHMTIVDYDVVALSNLNRQILHSTNSLGKAKVHSAQTRLSGLNPHVELRTLEIRWDDSASDEIIQEAPYALIIDASDNYSARFLSNKMAIKYKIHLVYGAVSGFNGQVGVFSPHVAPETGCYQCLLPELPPASDKPIGVIGTSPGLIGTLQATEALKLILGIGTPLVGKLFHFNGLTYRNGIISIPRNPHCPACSTI